MLYHFNLHKLDKNPSEQRRRTENEKLCSINGANVSFYGLHIKCKLLKRQQPETATCGGSSSDYLEFWSMSLLLSGCCLLLALLLLLLCIVALSHYVACDTVNDYMYMFSAPRPLRIPPKKSLWEWQQASGGEWSFPLSTVGLLVQPDDPTTKTVTWKSSNKCFGSHLWKSPTQHRRQRQRQRQRRQLATVVAVCSSSCELFPVEVSLKIHKNQNAFASRQRQQQRLTGTTRNSRPLII